MLLHSIRARFLVWLALLLVVVLAGFGITAYQLHRTNQMNQIDRELERRLAALDSVIGGPRPPGSERRARPHPDFGSGWRPPPPGEWEPRRSSTAPILRLGPREIRVPSHVLSLFEEAEFPNFYFAVWSRSGNLFTFPTNAPPGLLQPDLSPRDFSVQHRTRQGLREVYRFNEIGECVLTGRSIALDLAGIHRFGWLLALGGGGVLALGLGGGWWLVGNAMRPVHDISLAAGRISGGNLTERINVADTDNELGRLAEVLNSTFARLESAFIQQKQFTADAAHELRTPIAVLISEGQTALARERTANEYRETVEQCLDVAQQMRRLTESLLDLSRFDSRQEPLRLESADLAQIVAESVALVRPLARQRGVTVSCDLADAETKGDTQRLGQVATNLLTNAISYNQPNGQVYVRTFTEESHAGLEVSDTGRGISEEDLPHIFDRFFRADKSRSRAEGHAGLGLAICRAIVEAHGGKLTAASKVGEGSSFVVRLPR